MRISAAAFTFAATTLLFAQSSYRITHTYPLGHCTLSLNPHALRKTRRIDDYLKRRFEAVL
jgi:hypothetical protein